MSFGGVVAQEVAKLVNPKITIVISSIRESSQIPLLLRLTPDFVFKFPSFIFNLPQFLANYIFGAKNKTLLKEILKDTEGSFVKWALYALKN